MNGNLILTGDGNVPAMPMSESQVNHMRRVLAWLRLEYMLDEDMQRGYLTGALHAAAISPENAEVASEAVSRQVARVKHVPDYVRHGVKMLTKALREHDARSGVIDGQTENEPSIYDGDCSHPPDSARLQR